MIDLVKEANRVELDNIQASSEPTISEVDRAEVQQFLEAIQLLIQALRLNFFEKLSIQPAIITANDIIYEYKVKTAIGKMAIRDGKYILLTGSTAVKESRKSASRSIQKYRDELIADEALRYDEASKLFVVVKDIPFNSSSYAASIVCGGNAAGPVRWKYNGKTLKEIESTDQ